MRRDARREFGVTLGRRAADAGGGAVCAAIALVMVAVRMLVQVVRMRQLIARAAATMHAQREAFLFEAISDAWSRNDIVGERWAVWGWEEGGRKKRTILLYNSHKCAGLFCACAFAVSP